MSNQVQALYGLLNFVECSMVALPMLRGKAMEQKPKEGRALNKIACNDNSPKQDEALACIVSGLNLMAWHVDRAMESR
jgi:hypothetical protein